MEFIDTIIQGESGKRYNVATFWHDEGRSKYAIAYLRDYNPSWDGCVMFEVRATSGDRAKASARSRRREIEQSQ